MSPKSAQRFWDNDMHKKSMSPKSAQRFWGNDMHKNRNLKRVA
jgi:G:T-mismatch repair DNA endonuclease (very short patch repair protein)